VLAIVDEYLKRHDFAQISWATEAEQNHASPSRSSKRSIVLGQVLSSAKPRNGSVNGFPPPDLGPGSLPLTPLQQKRMTTPAFGFSPVAQRLLRSEPPAKRARLTTPSMNQSVLKGAPWIDEILTVRDIKLSLSRLIGYRGPMEVFFLSLLDRQIGMKS
jgi:hypothetical protein